MPRRSVGVALDAPVGPKLDDGLLGFLDSLDIARAYGFDHAHDAPFSLAMGRVRLSDLAPDPLHDAEGEMPARPNSSEPLDYLQAGIVEANAPLPVLEPLEFLAVLAKAPDAALLASSLSA